jgi:hypothetical protein
MSKANLKSTFKNYAKAVQSELDSLIRDRVVVRYIPPVIDEDRQSFELPRRIARVPNDAADRPEDDKKETVSSEYVRAVLESERWGVRFKDDSVAMLSFQMDEQHSRNNEFVPAAFCYLFATGERTVDGVLERAHFYRIEMHPNESGNLFGEPVVHLHGNRNKAPRFGISAAISPLDFLDFVVRNRFPKEWQSRKPEMFGLMQELHAKHTQRDARYRISDAAAYERQAELLGQLSIHRGIPEWKSPPTTRRYPFAV